MQPPLVRRLTLWINKWSEVKNRQTLTSTLTNIADWVKVYVVLECEWPILLPKQHKRTSLLFLGTSSSLSNQPMINKEGKVQERPVTAWQSISGELYPGRGHRGQNLQDVSARGSDRKVECVDYVPSLDLDPPSTKNKFVFLLSCGVGVASQEQQFIPWIKVQLVVCCIIITDNHPGQFQIVVVENPGQDILSVYSNFTKGTQNLLISIHVYNTTGSFPSAIPLSARPPLFRQEHMVHLRL